MSSAAASDSLLLLSRAAQHFSTLELVGSSRRSDFRLVTDSRQDSMLAWFVREMCRETIARGYHTEEHRDSDEGNERRTI